MENIKERYEKYKKDLEAYKSAKLTLEGEARVYCTEINNQLEELRKHYKLLDDKLKEQLKDPSVLENIDIENFNTAKNNILKFISEFDDKAAVVLDNLLAGAYK